MHARCNVDANSGVQITTGPVCAQGSFVFANVSRNGANQAWSSNIVGRTFARHAMVEKVHGPLVAHHNKLLARISKQQLQRIAADIERILEQLPEH